MFTKKTKEPNIEPGSTDVNDEGPCQKKIRMHVLPETIQPIRSAVVGAFRKQADVKGFRKGKAPASLIEQRYADSIQAETQERALKQALMQVVEDHKLRPVGSFEVSRVDFNDTTGLTIEAKVEVEPAFELGEYKGVGLKKEPVAVTEADIQQATSQLQASMARMVPAKEGQEETQGAEKKPKLPEVDDELAKDLGFKTLKELRGHIERKILEDKKNAQAQEIEGRLCDVLLQRHSFEVPAGLVAHQTEKLTQDFKARLILSGLEEAKVDEELKKFQGQLKENATRYVRLGFILDRISKAEGIEVTQQDLVERLWKLSRSWKKEPTEVRKILDEQNLWPSVQSTVRQEKTVAFLLKESNIEGETTTEAPAHE